MQESWIDRVIREAQEAGKLEPAEGAGKPIEGLSRPYDPAWWAKRWVASERAGQHAIDLHDRIQAELPRLLAGTVIDDIRSGLESLNAEIQVHNETYPGNSLPLLDVGQLMKERDLRHRG